MSLEKEFFDGKSTGKKKLFSAKKGVTLFSFAVGGLLVIAAAGALVARADFTEFFATSCSGSWANPERAAGSPEAQPGAPADSFNIGNSAVFVPQPGNFITCSGFDGQATEENRVLGAKIRLSWLFKYPEIPPPEQEEIISEPSAEIPAVEKSSEILESAVPVPENKEEVVPPTTDDTPEIIPEPAVQEVFPEPVPATEPKIEEVAPASEPQAWFINKVYAEESPQVRAELIFDNLEKFLQFDYSLDGEVWLPVEDAQLNIPVLTWEDVRRLQVRVTGLRQGEGLPEVYLDALWLEVEQAPIVEPESESLTDQLGDLAEQVAEAVGEIPQTVEEFIETQAEVVPQITEADLAPLAVEQKEPEEFLVFSKPSGVLDSLLGNISELVPNNKSVSLTVSDSGFSITGKCSAKYATVIMFSDPEYVKSDPSKALVNRAIDCVNGEFSVVFEVLSLPRSLTDGSYYLYVADQPEIGGWTLSAGPEILEVKKITR